MVNIIAFYTGFLIGKILAWRRGSKSETWITVTSVFSYTVFYPWFALMMLWFFGYRLGWLPIGKFLYPEKWYDAPFDSDVVFMAMIKFVAIASLIQVLAYVFTRNIESLSLRRNIRSVAFLILILGVTFLEFWRSKCIEALCYGYSISYDPTNFYCYSSSIRWYSTFDKNNDDGSYEGRLYINCTCKGVVTKEN